MSIFTYLSDIGNGLFAAHAGKYSQEEAAELFNDSYDHSIREKELRSASKHDASIRYIRFRPKGSSGSGKYRVSETNTKGCFRAWVIDSQELELFDE